MIIQTISIKSVTAQGMGTLSVFEGSHDVPFDIKRIYYIHGAPKGTHRGGHAHKHCREFIIAVSGSFSVTLDDGRERQSYLLNRPYQGLLVPTGIWRTLEDFSSGAVCLVLAEDPFDATDYIYDYNDFIQYRDV